MHKFSIVITKKWLYSKNNGKIITFFCIFTYAFNFVKLCFTCNDWFTFTQFHRTSWWMKRTMQSKWKDEMHHAKSNKKLKFSSVSDKFLHIQCEIKLKKNRRYTFELRILLAWFGFACENPDASFIRTNYFAFVQSDQIAYNCNLKSVHSAWDKYWNL